MASQSRQPADLGRSLQLAFSGRSHLATRVRVTFLILAFVACQPNSFAGDTETATDYADDAAASMELEYNALAPTVQMAPTVQCSENANRDSAGDVVGSLILPDQMLSAAAEVPSAERRVYGTGAAFDIWRRWN